MIDSLQVLYFVLFLLLICLRNKFDLFTLFSFSFALYFLPSIFYSYALPDGAGNLISINVSSKAVELKLTMMAIILLFIFINDVYFEKLGIKSRLLTILGNVKTSRHFLWFCFGVTIVFMAFSFMKTGGSFFCVEKFQVMEKLTTEYYYWMSGAILCIVLSYFEKKWLVFAICSSFLLFDLVAGFRVHLTIAVLAVAIAIFMHFTWRDYRKIFFTGILFLSIGIFLILVKGVLWKTKYLVSNLVDSSCIQNTVKANESFNEIARDLIKETINAETTKTSIQYSEPFIIYSVFNETVEHEFTLSIQSFKSQMLALLPGYSTISGTPFSDIKFFESSFREAFYPTINYQVGGSFWAQLFAYFKRAGVFLGLIVVLLLLSILNTFMQLGNTIIRSIAIVGGVWISFYIHRNDIVTIGSILKVFTYVTIISFVFFGGFQLLRKKVSRATAN